MANNKSVQLELEIPANKVDAQPTKQFFVQMLTRDISLIDAIMDLVDNCIDGIHRQQDKNAHKSGSFYKGYKAEIDLNENGFSIKDNCGGIPEDVAKNYAFKMGRDEKYEKDKNLETVGVYGIGMKRAIFKIGTKADVISHHNASTFKVTVPENWANSNDWLFDFKKLTQKEVIKSLPTNGTLLEVKGIHSNIKQLFSDKEGFQKNLRERLREHYGYIIQNGFELKLNGIAIKSLELNLIVVEPTGKRNRGIKPYVYKGTVDEVDMEVTIGFYRPPAEAEEIEKGLDGSYPKSSSENAGITVLCNDRVVLYANKDLLTGWGEPPIPLYHTQFINILGVVRFRSKNPIKLPVTTTKRGADTSSAVYAIARSKMRDGLKYFTSFTNHWKTPSEERAKLFAGAKRFNVLAPDDKKKYYTNTKKDKSGEYQIPDLPRPNDEKRDNNVNISFNRDKIMVEKMKDYFFDGANKSASEIGGWCFDELYSQIE